MVNLRTEGVFYERLLVEFDINSTRDLLRFSIQFAVAVLPMPLIPSGPFGWYGELQDLDLFEDGFIRDLHWSASWFELALSPDLTDRWQALLERIAPAINSRLVLEELRLDQKEEISKLKAHLDTSRNSNHDRIDSLLLMAQDDPSISKAPHWRSYISAGMNGLPSIS